MDSRSIEKVLVDSIHKLEDTRWNPSGPLKSWAATVEGRNHELVFGVLDTLRDTLIQLRSSKDRDSISSFHEGMEREYNSDF